MSGAHQHACLVLPVYCYGCTACRERLVINLKSWKIEQQMAFARNGQAEWSEDAGQSKELSGGWGALAWPPAGLPALLFRACNCLCQPLPLCIKRVQCCVNPSLPHAPRAFRHPCLPVSQAAPSTCRGQASRSP